MEQVDSGPPSELQLCTCTMRTIYLPTDIVHIVLRHACHQDVDRDWFPTCMFNKYRDGNISALGSRFTVSNETLNVCMINKEYNALVRPCIMLTSRDAQDRVNTIVVYVVASMHDTPHVWRKNTTKAFSVMYDCIFTFSRFERADGFNSMYSALADTKETLFGKARTPEEKEDMIRRLVSLFRYSLHEHPFNERVRSCCLSRYMDTTKVKRFKLLDIETMLRA